MGVGGRAPLSAGPTPRWRYRGGMSDDETRLDHIPGAAGLPLVGESVPFLRDAVGFDARRNRRHGPLWRTRVLGRTVVSVSSADLVGEMLVDRRRCFSSAHGWEHTLAMFFPRGLMLRDFDDHAAHRRILRAAFTRTAREGYHEAIQRGFAATLTAWSGRGRIDFYPAIKRALLDQATRVFLGLDPATHGDLLTRDFARIVRAIPALVRQPLPGTAWRRGLAARRSLDAVLRAEIPSRRGSGRPDLFSRLCDAADPETGARLDDAEVVDHLIFLLFAAHDTTATALTALVDQLSAAPELMARAIAECRGIARDPSLDPSLGPHALAWGQLDALGFVERCFREALRLTPPVMYIARRTTRACELGGHSLPARTPVSVQVRAPQVDPAFWREPERFDPDRFAEGRAEDHGHRHAWIPFGGGAHRCLGAELAEQQVKVFVHQLLRGFEVERVREGPTAWGWLPLPRPRDGLPLRLRPARP